MDEIKLFFFRVLQISDGAHWYIYIYIYVWPFGRSFPLTSFSFKQLAHEAPTENVIRVYLITTRTPENLCNLSKIYCMYQNNNRPYA